MVKATEVRKRKNHTLKEMNIETPLAGIINSIEKIWHGRSIRHEIKTFDFSLSLPFFANKSVRELKVGDQMKIEPETSSGVSSRHCLKVIFTRGTDEIKEIIAEIPILSSQILF